MKIIYSIAVKLYSVIVALASLFNKKASYRYKGVKETFKKIKNFSLSETIWIHCASLGEFEQGRSLIEEIKKKHPNYKAALSFFSPSGYEIIKNCEHADLIFYLPHDSRKNAKKLISLLKPKIVFFVKYEFWYWYINETNKNNIPIYLISGIFRKNQVFFKFYGKFFREILKKFTHIFVQNKESEILAKQINIPNVSVTGDTRFDRVFEISQNRKKFEIIDAFTENKLTFIAGSTWKPDEDILFEFINKSNQDIKYIIAPHEVKKDNIAGILKLSKKNIIKYSEATVNSVKNADVMIIDNIGMLSSLYAYADIAYIGGGFGAGIHNTLEAAVFGIPIIFGPKYQKFDEAKELIKRKAGFSIFGKDDFFQIAEKLINDLKFRELSGKNSKVYVHENVGATNKIFNAIAL